MNHKKLAQIVIENVGGESNISGMTHCATRLRLNLKDSSKANTNILNDTEGVISVVEKGGQYQIIIGTEVNKVYSELENMISDDLDSNLTVSETDNTKNIFSNIFSTISGIFTPLLPAFAGSGILRGLVLLAVQAGILAEDSGTYAILTVAAMSVFYFLPVELAFTAALKFKVSPYIAVLIGGSLINPDFLALMGEQGNGAVTSFLGIPVVLMNYAYTVIPIILSIWVYSYLDRFLRRVMPSGLELVFVPLISLVIMVPLTVIAIGSIGVYGGEMIASLVNNLIESSGLLAGILVGGGWNVLVMLGLHWAVNPIMINNIATLGYDYIVPLTFATNFAMMGAVFGVFLKTRNKKMKSYALSCVLTIAFAGITEPGIYGVAVKLKKPFIAAIIGGAIGGGFMGWAQVSSNAFVFGGLTTLSAFVGGGFMYAIIGLLMSFAISAVVAYGLGFENPSTETSLSEEIL